MIKATVQINNGKAWNTSPCTLYTFASWRDKAIFCYRVAKMHNREVRAEQLGTKSGHYYQPKHADKYLNEQLKTTV